MILGAYLHSYMQLNNYKLYTNVLQCRSDTTEQASASNSRALTSTPSECSRVTHVYVLFHIRECTECSSAIVCGSQFVSASSTASVSSIVTACKLACVNKLIVQLTLLIRSLWSASGKLVSWSSQYCVSEWYCVRENKKKSFVWGMS